MTGEENTHYLLHYLPHITTVNKYTYPQLFIIKLQTK